MRRLFTIAILSTIVAGCSGEAFSSSDAEVFELETSATPAPGEPDEETALRCGCDYLGSYDDREYWECPLGAEACLKSRRN